MTIQILLLLIYSELQSRSDLAIAEPRETSYLLIRSIVERMEEGNRRSNNNEGKVLLRILRDVEATPNSNATETITTTERPQSEDHVDAEHLVSSMTVNIIELQNVSRNELQNITENVGLAELHEEWEGEMIHRTRITAAEIAESDEDYLVTKTLAENVIVIRYIDDFRRQSDVISKTQIIWNSKFTWRDIKQHLENDTYKFYFKYEIISFGEEIEIITSDAEEIEMITSDAIDALPAVISRQEKEMCTICHETFSTVNSAKQLPCTHSFHSKCILLWFDRNHSCPICRREVVLQQHRLVLEYENNVI